jgi:hypothetical protein
MIAGLEGEEWTRVSQIRGAVTAANKNFVAEINEALTTMERGTGLEFHFNSKGVHEE